MKTRGMGTNLVLSLVLGMVFGIPRLSGVPAQAGELPKAIGHKRRIGT